MGSASGKTLALALLAGCTAIFACVAVLTVQVGTLHVQEGIAIALGTTMAFAAPPVIWMAWRGRLDLLAIMEDAGSTGAGGRRWARAWPAIMVGFGLGGVAIALQELAQWRTAHGHPAHAWNTAGNLALALCGLAFLTSVAAGLTGRPRWAIAPAIRIDRDFV
jgi:hypothetical protein